MAGQVRVVVTHHFPGSSMHLMFSVASNGTRKTPCLQVTTTTREHAPHSYSRWSTYLGRSCRELKNTIQSGRGEKWWRRRITRVSLGPRGVADCTPGMATDRIKRLEPRANISGVAGLSAVYTPASIQHTPYRQVDPVSCGGAARISTDTYHIRASFRMPHHVRCRPQS